MDAIEALRGRRSVRAYFKRPIDREVLEEIADCGRLAPSGLNLQPCDLIMVTDATLRSDLADYCASAPFMGEAAALVAIAVRKQGMFLEDAACVATCMMVAARAHDLGSCWFHVLDKPYEPEIRELLKVPRDRQVVCIISLGYGEFPPAPDKRPLSDVLHWERFAAPAGE